MFVCCQEYFSLWFLSWILSPSPSQPKAPFSMEVNWSHDHVCHTWQHVDAKQKQKQKVFSGQFCHTFLYRNIWKNHLRSVFICPYLRGFSSVLSCPRCCHLYINLLYYTLSFEQDPLPNQTGTVLHVIPVAMSSTTASTIKKIKLN